MVVGAVVVVAVVAVVPLDGMEVLLLRQPVARVVQAAEPSCVLSAAPSPYQEPFTRWVQRAARAVLLQPVPLAQ